MKKFTDDTTLLDLECMKMQMGVTSLSMFRFDGMVRVLLEDGEGTASGKGETLTEALNAAFLDLVNRQVERFAHHKHIPDHELS